MFLNLFSKNKTLCSRQEDVFRLKKLISISICLKNIKTLNVIIDVLRLNIDYNCHTHIQADQNL